MLLEQVSFNVSFHRMSDFWWPMNDNKKPRTGIIPRFFFFFCSSSLVVTLLVCLVTLFVVLTACMQHASSLSTWSSWWWWSSSSLSSYSAAPSWWAHFLWDGLLVHRKTVWFLMQTFTWCSSRHGFYLSSLQPFFRPMAIWLQPMVH